MIAFAAFIFSALVAVAKAGMEASQVGAALAKIKEEALEVFPKERRFIIERVMRSLSVEGLETGVDPQTNQTLQNVSALLDDVLQNFRDGKAERDVTIASYLASGDNCNTQHMLQDGWYSANYTQNDQDHLTCRSIELSEYNEMVAACATRDNYLTSIRDDGVHSFCTPPQATQENVDFAGTELTAGLAYFTQVNQTYTQYAQNCTQTTNDLAAQRAVCNAEQHDLETGFCLWNAHQTMMCTDRPICHTAASDLYDIYVAATTPISDTNAALARIVLHITCLIDGLCFHNSTDLSLCPFHALNATELLPYRNTFPPFPPVEPCSTANTTIRPGHADWETNHYSTIVGTVTPPEATFTCGGFTNITERA